MDKFLDEAEREEKADDEDDDALDGPITNAEDADEDLDVLLDEYKGIPSSRAERTGGDHEEEEEEDDDDARMDSDEDGDDMESIANSTEKSASKMHMDHPAGAAASLANDDARGASRPFRSGLRSGCSE